MMIDGNSLANRAFYAIPMLSNSQGFITNAIYGFCNMLLRVINEEKPDYLAVAFDKGKVVFRHEEYSDYKAGRKGTPDELRAQFPVLKRLLCAMNIAVLECENYEADDILGKLVKLGEKEGLENLIVTGDRDALQLISKQTKVVLTKKGISELEWYDEAALKEKYGLVPAQMIELKGLMGDASDHIPGIPGVGEKTALKLIQEYGDIENVLANRGNYKGKKLGELLEQHGDLARMSRRLATINTDFPFDVSLDSCRMAEPDYPEVISLLKELEFKNILENMLAKMAATDNGTVEKEQEQIEGRLVSEPGLLQEYLSQLNRSVGEITIWLTTEKTGPACYAIKELAVKTQGGPAEMNLPLVLTWQDEEELKSYLKILKPYLEEKSLKKTIHDAKAAYLAFDAYGIKLNGVCYDVMLMAYLLNPSRGETDLATLAHEYLNVHVASSCSPQREYLLLNSIETLGDTLAKGLFDAGMWELYSNLELPLCTVLKEMEQTGVYIDDKILSEIGDELDVRIGRLTAEIYESAGEEFNINSPKQLGVILFDKLGLARGKKTKTGYSTNAAVLESLAAEHEIVAKILDYRQLVKLKSTYIDGLLGIMDPQTKKVHTTFKQALTATGRLSSTEPNLQNIPIRLEEGRRIRKAFLPSPGNLLLAADYSQIELRVLAHIAQDEVLIEAFNSDQDIHTRTAAEVFGMPMEAVTKEMRHAAKAVNFGIVYGISDFGLSQDLGISRAQAKDYIDNYFNRYRGVRLYIDKVIAEARETGYVTTILNRRRYLPDILSKNFNLRSFAERTAMNTPIQGSAADITKLAMIRLREELLQNEHASVMLLQVHDELIFDVPVESIESFGGIVNDIMSKAYPLSVPLKVDLQKGSNWYDLSPLKI